MPEFMINLESSAASSWMLLRIFMVVYGFLTWEFVSQFPDEIRLIFWPLLRKFVKTGLYDGHSSTACLLLARLLLIPMIATQLSSAFLGGSDDQCTMQLRATTGIIAVANANAQTILNLRTIAIANPSLRVKFALWGLTVANLTTWSYSAATMRGASITTWYPSFGFNCHIIFNDVVSLTTMFCFGLLAYLIMAYYTVRACVSAVNAERVAHKRSTLAQIKSLVMNEDTGPDSLTRRVATFALGDSVWLFFLATFFDIFGALWVLVFLVIKHEAERGSYIMPFKQLLIFGIGPRTIISMKRITAETRPDHSIKKLSIDPPASALPSPHPMPVSPARPLIRRRSWCSLTESTSYPELNSHLRPFSIVRKEAPSRSKSDDLATSQGFEHGQSSTPRLAREYSVSSRLEHFSAEMPNNSEILDALGLKTAQTTNSSDSDCDTYTVGQAM